MPVVPVVAGLLLAAPNGLGAGVVVGAPNNPPVAAAAKPEEGRPKADVVGCPKVPVAGGFVAGVLDTPNAEGGCAAGVDVCPAGVEGVVEAGCGGCWPKEKPVFCLEGSFGLLRNAAESQRGDSNRGGRYTSRNNSGRTCKGRSTENRQCGDWRRKYVKPPGRFEMS